MRIYLQLKREGVRISYEKVFALYTELHLTLRKNKTKKSKPSGIIDKANLLVSNVSPTPFKIFATDGVQFVAGNKVVHFAFVMDLHSRFIIYYNSSLHEDTAFYNELLMKFNANIISDHSDMTLHTDHGSVFTSCRFNDHLEELGIKHSMSSKGKPIENCMIENFHKILRDELDYDKKSITPDELTSKMDEYIQYYNYERISAVEGTTPFERMLDYYKDQFDTSNIKNLKQLLKILEN